MYARSCRFAMAAAGVAACVVLASCGSDDEPGKSAGPGMGAKGPKSLVTEADLLSALVAVEAITPDEDYQTRESPPYPLANPTRPGDPDYGKGYESVRFEPEGCGQPVDAYGMGGPGAPRAERAYFTQRWDDGKGDDPTYGLSLASADRDVLVQQFNAFVASLQDCRTFSVVDGNDSTSYKITDVRVGQYGPMTVGYRFDYYSEADFKGHVAGALALAGATSVQVFTSQAESAPDDPGKLLETQLAKVAKLADSAEQPE